MFSAHSSVRHLWTPLEDFFASQGYTLHNTNKKKYRCAYGPPEPVGPRVKDDYHHVLPEDQTDLLWKFDAYVRGSPSLLVIHTD